MKGTLILSAAAAAATVAVAAPADAQRYRGANWRTVAYATVNGHDSDTI
jgi:hypothetical protein